MLDVKRQRAYEVASDAQRHATTASGKGDSATKVGITRSLIGNAPERAVAGGARTGQSMLEAFPGTLPSFGAATFDDELEQTKQSLPR